MNVELIGAELGQAVLAFALTEARKRGFSWVECPEKDFCPSTLPQIQREAAEAHRSGTNFRVYSGDSDKTIYPHAFQNIAFRFWHDMLHLDSGLGVSLEDELKVGRMHVDALRTAGYSQAHQDLMWIDTCGQSLFNYIRGDFPVDQMQFAKDVIEAGDGVIGKLRESHVFAIATKGRQ